MDSEGTGTAGYLFVIFAVSVIAFDPMWEWFVFSLRAFVFILAATPAALLIIVPLWELYKYIRKQLA